MKIKSIGESGTKQSVNKYTTQETQGIVGYGCTVITLKQSIKHCQILFKIWKKTKPRGKYSISKRDSEKIIQIQMYSSETSSFEIQEYYYMKMIEGKIHSYCFDLL